MFSERDLSFGLSRAVSRRTVLAAIPGLAMLALGVSCGGNDDDDEGGSSSTSSEPTSTSAPVDPTASAATGGEPTATTEQAESTNAPDDSDAAAQAAASDAGSDDQLWEFIDDRGMTVSLPKRPERVVAQVTAAAALWDYGIRPVAVFGPQRREDGSQDPQSGSIDLDTVESLGEAWGEFDLEALIALEPDLLVSQSYGGESLWYVPDEALAAMADIVPTAAILVQDIPISEPINRFEELAGLLGADLESAEVVDAKAAFDEAEGGLRSALEEKQDLSVLVIAGDVDQLYVANPEIATDLIYFRELGMNVVQPDTEEFWEALSWEQVTKHPADLILNDTRTQSLTPEQLAEIPTWNEHPAVQAGQVGPWFSEATYSHKSYATVLQEMADVIQESRADVV